MNNETLTAEEPALGAARSVLFDLLCGAPTPTPLRKRLTEAQWHWIAQTARDHRLLPLLHAAARAGPADLWPDQLIEQAEASYRTHSMRWLTLQSAMRQIGTRMAEAGIGYVFLKGATLASTVFPEPALRPLRDLDILVEDTRAIDAQGLLDEMGYRPLPGRSAKPKAGHYQLPALHHPGTRVTVEVHRSLASGLAYDPAPLAQRLLATAQEHNIANRPVLLAEPAALYCHLLLHAGLKSTFDCGPLVVADIAFLHALDPSQNARFGEAAEEFGLARSHALFAAILARHGPIAHADGSPAAVPDRLVDYATALLALPSEAVRNRKLVRNLRQGKPLGSKLLGMLRHAIRPTRAKIAVATGARPDSRFVLLGYPIWLVDRAWHLATGGADADRMAEADADLQLEDWLARSDAPPTTDTRKKSRRR